MIDFSLNFKLIFTNIMSYIIYKPIFHRPSISIPYPNFLISSSLSFHLPSFHSSSSVTLLLNQSFFSLVSNCKCLFSFQFCVYSIFRLLWFVSFPFLFWGGNKVLCIKWQIDLFDLFCRSSGFPPASIFQIDYFFPNFLRALILLMTSRVCQ